MRSILLALLSAAAAGAAEPAPPAAARPNVLFVLADDLRPDGLHALGNPIVKTPHLDRLVQTGVHLPLRLHAGLRRAAVCLPSRTMIQTGCSYSAQRADRSHVGPDGGRGRLRLDPQRQIRQQPR